MLLPELEPVGVVEFRLVLVIGVAGVMVLEYGIAEVVALDTVDEVVVIEDVAVLDIVEVALVELVVTLSEAVVVVEGGAAELVGVLVLENDCVELARVVPFVEVLIDDELNGDEGAVVVEAEGLVVDAIEVVVEEVAQVPPGTFRTCPSNNLSQSTPGLATFKVSALTVRFFAIL